MQKRNLHNFLKVLMVSFITCSMMNVAKAQTVEIFSNAGTSGNIVTGPQAYQVGENLYLNSEIGNAAFTSAATSINRVEFSVNTMGDPNSYANFNIYMKETTQTTVAAGTYNTTGFTLVYSGSIDVTATGWIGFNLTTPFVRTPGSNLLVMIERLDGVSPTTPIVWDASRGNGTSATAVMTRRYIGATAPVSGTTAYSQTSVFRPAIRFIHVADADAGLVGLDLPAASCYNAGQSMSVTIQNSGTTTAIGAGAATVTLQVTGANTFTATATNPGAIATGGTGVVSFNNVMLSNVGTNNITAIVSFPGDAITNNDTIRGSVATTGVISTFPINEGFEATPPSSFPYTKVVLGTDNGWTYQSGTYTNTSNPTTSLAPHSGTGFYYFNAFDVTSGNNSVLHSGCISLPQGTASVSFFMSHDTLYTSLGRYTDSVYLTISTDRGMTFNRVAGFARLDPNYPTVGWKQESFDLSAYAGQTIQIGFEGVSYYGNIIGLDDISVTAQAIIPVKLVSFTGERLGKANRLNWVTATEANNAGFELQRSADGVNYSKIAFLGTKAEGGNSTASLNYNYTDNSALASANYYRLKQINKDGKYEYSNIVLMKGNGTTAIEIAAVYPNPVVSRLNLIVTSASTAKATIIVTDVTGKVVMQKTAQVNTGDNNMPLDVRSIANGTYNLKVATETGTANMKFVKQ